MGSELEPGRNQRKKAYPARHYDPHVLNFSIYTPDLRRESQVINNKNALMRFNHGKLKVETQPPRLEPLKLIFLAQKLTKIQARVSNHVERVSVLRFSLPLRVRANRRKMRDEIL